MCAGDTRPTSDWWAGWHIAPVHGQRSCADAQSLRLCHLPAIMEKIVIIMGEHVADRVYNGSIPTIADYTV
jgi:hypothetical protein